MLPILIPCALLLIGKKPLLSPLRIKKDSFNTLFLFYVAGMPFLLTLAISLILGTTLRAGWGMPLLSTAGIMLMMLIQPRLSRAKIIAFLVFMFTLLIAQVSGYSLSLLFPTSTSSANFPGREIANRITTIWHDTYHTRLEYVGGSRWIGGNIGFYSPDHPAVFIELNEQLAPWINIQDMHKKGAVLVWEMSQGNDLPEKAKQTFLQFKNIKIIKFDWHRNNIKLTPISIGVVILPPQNQT